MIRLISALAILLAFISPTTAHSADRSVAEGPQAGAEPVPGVLRLGFDALQGELQRHRELAASGGWPVLARGPTIRPGDEGPRIAALADRLAASGDLERSAASAHSYDESLQSAVRDFQSRHGLEPDSLVGRVTLRALNVSADQRVAQIERNLERMRPYLDIDVEHFVIVNIAAFRATLVRAGREVWSTKVIIGGKEDQTPEFRSDLKSVVINPTWSVPYSIASEEMLPRILGDPDYFTDNGYDVFDREGNPIDPADVDWSVYSERNFPFRLVQRPGPANQLGRVKFVMPNPYSICMHDTPAKALFANVNRALSHGCVRIEDPLRFAELVLESEGVAREQIDLQLKSGETRSITLQEPLPVYVVYWTAEADESGLVRFYDDIYDWDARYQRRSESAASDKTAKSQNAMPN